MEFSHKGKVKVTHEQSIICHKIHLDGITHKQAIICWQLFAGHVVGSRRMKREKIVHRMRIKSRYS